MLAERWGCKQRVVLRMIQDGQLPAFQIGNRSWRVKADDVVAFEAAGDMPRDTRPVIVYVIRAGEMVKIGKAVNVAKRLKGLQTASPVPLSVIHTIASDDGDALEIELHRRFAAHRANGEWFRLEGALAEWITGGFSP
jgi:excisionase family DNA binding protein